MPSTFRIFATIVSIMIWSNSPVWAQGNSKNKPEITAAVVSPDQTVLFVQGANFGPHPIVTLGDVQLTGVSVDASGRQLTAQLPVVPPGTYLLTVTSGPMSTSFAASIDYPP